VEAGLAEWLGEAEDLVQGAGFFRVCLLQGEHEEVDLGSFELLGEVRKGQSSLMRISLPRRAGSRQKSTYMKKICSRLVHYSVGQDQEEGFTWGRKWVDRLWGPTRMQRSKDGQTS
jgi:hypothetical protein